MLILASNDDGYFSPGLEALVRAISTLADVVVIAPDTNRSGASNSLTLDRPLSLKRASNGFYFLNGTPTDCVHIALTGFLERKPDLIVSGINDGQNMGDDTLYSGTVAAAMEGFLFGVPAMAFSLADKGYGEVEAAAEMARRLVMHFLENRYSQPTLLNVNIPNLPLSLQQGFRTTRLGKRHPSEAVQPGLNPFGEPIYWIGPAGKVQDAGEGTDFHAVEHGHVSVTPLRSDLTHRDQIAGLDEWLAPVHSR